MPGYNKRASALHKRDPTRLEQIAPAQQCHVKRYEHYRSERAPECPPQDSLFLAKEVVSP